MLYPGGTKGPEPPDGTWVGIETEVFKALYPGGSDGFGLDGSGVPIGFWVTTTFPVKSMVARGTIERAIWRGRIK
jgi:hypothetical protein